MGSQNPKIEALHSDRIAQSKLGDFRVGDTVKVHYKVVEGDKERIQVFQGQVIRRRQGGVGSTFTVRKISFNNVGVERMFPLFSPRIDKIEIMARGKVRRARLFYLRELEGKAARLKDARHSTTSSSAAAAPAAAQS